MKAIFAICVILAFACAQATFTPKWRPCERYNAGWETQNLTLDAAPFAGQNSTFIFCGTNKDFYVVDIKQVRATAGLIDLTFPLKDTSIGWTASGCYSVSLQVPEISKVSIRFESTALALGKVGCVDVLLYPSTNKFLAF